MASREEHNLWRKLVLVLINLAWSLLTHLARLLKRRQTRLEHASPHRSINPGGVASGKTVLVTVGRHAKTLHIARALKDVGATVIVTDYSPISMTALSTACDKMIVLPTWDCDALHLWVDHFKSVLVENNVDLVLPVSTINDVLLFGLAKQQLASQLPHVKWLCPDLENSILLDDRTQFAACCDSLGVPHPEHGKLVSRAAIPAIAEKFPDGVILKRVESTRNREEEVVRVLPGESAPACVSPSADDPWQWQRYVSGSEYSAWYVCVNGEITLSACYRSSTFLLAFDACPIAEDVDKPLRHMIKSLGLNGQFAFDFMTDEKTGRSYVFECNPRASSILETISKTPRWGEAFFGVNVEKRKEYNSVGFTLHRTSWPWANRSDGHFEWNDPLPFFGGQLVWPLHALATEDLTGLLAVDLNIGKIVVKGLSAGRDYAAFQSQLVAHKVDIALDALQHMNTLFLDLSIPRLGHILQRCKSAGVRVVMLRHVSVSGRSESVAFADVLPVVDKSDIDEVMELHTNGETRVLLGPKLSQICGVGPGLSYRIVRHGHTWHPKCDIPLRKLRVLHVMGSNANAFYDTLSSSYGFKCIKNIGSNGRFEHYVAYIHPSGLWSVGPYVDNEYFTEKAERLSTGKAITALEALSIDVVEPHMFDYDGMTAFRSLFCILKIPIIGCSAEALALSTSKSRTNACAQAAGIPVPPFEVLRQGETPTIARPFVVKPSEEDNSQGLRVVKKSEDIAEALENAFNFCDEVICEKFIEPGRELRVALVEAADGTLQMAPVIEYVVTDDDPVRTKEHKLDLSDSGRVTKVVGGAPGGVIMPAVLDDELKSKIYEMLCKAHRALGCRDYSIYDIRVDPEGEPYMLETCLYCSFADTSVIMKMQSNDGVNKSQLFHRLAERTFSRRYLGNQTEEGSGMRVRS